MRILRAEWPAPGNVLDRCRERAPSAGPRSWARALSVLCVAFVLAFSAGGCSRPGGWKILDPQTQERDYDIALGRIPYGEERKHLVRMRNDEGRDVAIHEIVAGCSCTAVRAAYVDESGKRVEAPSLWGEAPFVVPRGATLELALNIVSTASPNPNAPKRVLVRMRSDSEVDPAKTLEVHFVVEMPFYVVPKVIDLGLVPVGGIAQGKTEITGATGAGEQILGVLEKPDVFDVRLESPEETGTYLWRLHVRWFPPLDPGPQSRYVVLETSGPGGQGQGRPLSVEVRAIGVENVIADPMLFRLPATIEAGAGCGAVELRSLVAGNRLRVTGARVEGAESASFRATATAVSPDDAGRSERWMVQLTCVETPRIAGEFGGKVIVELDDATTPEVRIPYLRKVAP